MEDHLEPVITLSDRLDNGIAVTFEDGKTAFFSARLLYEMLPQAETMPSDSEASDLPQSMSG